MTGNPRLVADRDGEGHADRAWACFLGCGAAGGGAPAYGYTPATRIRRFDEMPEGRDGLPGRPPADLAPLRQRGAW